jgi:hypothetical protein
MSQSFRVASQQTACITQLETRYEVVSGFDRGRSLGLHAFTCACGQWTFLLKAWIYAKCMFHVVLSYTSTTSKTLHGRHYMAMEGTVVAQLYGGYCKYTYVHTF